jgi:adenosylhomocysteine nucleosidase
MQSELQGLLPLLEDAKSETVSGITFHRGRLCGVPAVLAVMGIGKVFAAIAAQTVILKYSPALLINTGVAGTLSPALSVGDVVRIDYSGQVMLSYPPQIVAARIQRLN